MREYLITLYPKTKSNQYVQKLYTVCTIPNPNHNNSTQRTDQTDINSIQIYKLWRKTKQRLHRSNGKSIKKSKNSPEIEKSSFPPQNWLKSDFHPHKKSTSQNNHEVMCKRDIHREKTGYTISVNRNSTQARKNFNANPTLSLRWDANSTENKKKSVWLVTKAS